EVKFYGPALLPSRSTAGLPSFPGTSRRASPHWRSPAYIHDTAAAAAVTVVFHSPHACSNESEDNGTDDPGPPVRPLLFLDHRSRFRFGDLRLKSGDLLLTGKGKGRGRGIESGIDQEKRDQDRAHQAIDHVHGRLRGRPYRSHTTSSRKRRPSCGLLQTS